VSLGWLLYNLTEVITLALTRLTARTESKLDDQVVPIIRKALRIFVIVVSALFTAENVFGTDISAWLAGLGIVGLALSLAAQDSVKNVFGSITVLFDRPFQVGDRIQFDGYDGVVEEIGFRSMRIRTLAGELVTIPNSKVVDGSVMNISRRRAIRRIVDIAITYDTPPDKVRRALDILREILADPRIASALDPANPPQVFFTDLSAYSLNLRVWYWFAPADWWPYVAHAERFNLMLLERFNAEGIDFAFPTQTLHLASDPKRRLAVESAARS